MSDDLVQRVRDELYAVLNKPQSYCEAIARAIIPLVKEHCAAVADEYAAWHSKMDHGLSGFDKMAEGAREVADVIRDGDA